MTPSIPNSSPNFMPVQDLYDLTSLAIEKIEDATEMALTVQEQLPLFDQTLEAIMQERMVYIQEIQEAAQHNHALKATHAANIKAYNATIRQKEQELKELDTESKELSRKIEVLNRRLPELEKHYVPPFWRQERGYHLIQDSTPTLNSIQKELEETLTLCKEVTQQISAAKECLEKESSSSEEETLFLRLKNEILQITQNPEDTENLCTEIAQTSSTPLDLTKIAEESEETLALCTEVIEQSSTMIERLEKQNFLVREKIAALHKENEKLQEAQQTEINRKKEILSDLQTRITKMQAEVDQKKSNYQPLKDTLTVKEEDCKKFRRACEELDRREREAARIRSLR